MPAEVLADAGYCNEADLAAMEARGIRGHVALGQEGWKYAAIDRDRRPATHWMGVTPGDAARPGALYAAAEVVGGSAKRMDQGSSRVPSVPCAGPERVQGEWSLVCLALNIRRMSGLRGRARHPEIAALHEYPKNP